MKAVLVTIALLLGCNEDPVSVTPTNNPSVTVGLLFSHQGCDVYRFLDVGLYHYYVRCIGGGQGVTETHAESCGKNCVTIREQSTVTEVAK